MAVVGLLINALQLAWSLLEAAVRLPKVKQATTFQDARSRAREIRLQPTARPLWLAAGIAIGLGPISLELNSFMLDLWGIRLDQNPLVLLLSVLAAMGYNAFVAMCAYRIGGGSRPQVFALLTITTQAIFGLSEGIFQAFQALAAMTLFESPFFVWGAYKRLPMPSIPISGSSNLPLSLSFSLMTDFFTLAMARVQLHFNTSNNQGLLFTERFTTSLGFFHLMSRSALFSVECTRLALLAKRYQWHWRAFLSPVIVTLSVELGINIASALPDKTGTNADLPKSIKLLAACGTSGVLGVYYFLRLAEDSEHAALEATQHRARARACWNADVTNEV